MFIEDGAIEQNTYDFLLVFYSKFGRISYRFWATVDLCQNDIAERPWPLNDSKSQPESPPKRYHLEPATLKSIDYNVAMTFILNNNNNHLGSGPGPSCEKSTFFCEAERWQRMTDWFDYSCIYSLNSALVIRSSISNVCPKLQLNVHGLVVENPHPRIKLVKFGTVFSCRISHLGLRM